MKATKPATRGRAATSRVRSERERRGRRCKDGACAKEHRDQPDGDERAAPEPERPGNRQKIAERRLIVPILNAIEFHVRRKPASPPARGRPGRSRRVLSTGKAPVWAIWRMTL